MDFRNDTQASGSQGLRNNNPGNFRPGIQWQGIAGTSNNFIVFSDVTYGLRAMALNLYNNYYVNGKKTLLSFISKYAPASDGNNPQVYAATVADEVGIAPDADMELDRFRVAQILRAMMNVELGHNYSQMISDEDILQGVDMIGKFEIIAIQAEGIVKKNFLPIVLGTSLLISVYVYFIIKKNNG